MPATVALDTEFATLRIDTAKGIVHHTFKQYMYGEGLQRVLSRGTELMEQHHATKWLSDDRKNAALSKSDTEWCTTVWFPRTKKAGWKTWAIVLPKMVIGQMNMQVFMDMYKKQGVEVRVFETPEEAMTWLESVK